MGDGERSEECGTQPAQNSTTHPMHGQGNQGQYVYSPLPKGYIRLLRLLPNSHPYAPIECQLFSLNLQRAAVGTDLFEALSYSWGNLDKPFSVWIEGRRLAITASLHGALSRLRGRLLGRTLWVDAVCINQEDLLERGHQVQSMARIYRMASRVIVWLGESETGSDQAIERIRALAAGGIIAEHEKRDHRAVLRLLQRPWFTRIWVLQEVAAARHVLMMCGSVDIDGYVFSLGISLLDLPGHRILPRVQSTLYLVRGSIFRPRENRPWSDTVSLNMHPMGQLVDMYHAHEATDRRDKIFALVGMSSDISDDAALSVDYTAPWEDVFAKLIKSILGDEVAVETWTGVEMAAIKAKGTILGQVAAVKQSTVMNGRQELTVILCTSSKRISAFATSTQTIMSGDLVCIVQGASRPTIVRLRRDFVSIIAVSIPWDGIKENVEQGSHQLPLRGLLMVWDWLWPQTSTAREETFEKLVESKTGKPGGYGQRRNALERWLLVGRLYRDVVNYKSASERYQKALELGDDEGPDSIGPVLLEAADTWEKLVGNGRGRTLQEIYVLLGKAITARTRVQPLDHADVLAAKEKQAIMCHSEHFQETETLMKSVIDARIRILGSSHGATIKSIQHLASIYNERGWYGHYKTWQEFGDMLGHNAALSDEILLETLKLDDRDLLRLLFQQRGLEPCASRGLSLLASCSRPWPQIQPMVEFLLQQGGENVQVPERLILLAICYPRFTADAMRRLLDFAPKCFDVSGNLLWIVAKADTEGCEASLKIKHLLDHCRRENPVTEFLLETAAANRREGLPLMEILLSRSPDTVQISSDILTAALRNDTQGLAILERMLPYSWDVSEGVFLAAASRQYYGLSAIKYLLEKRGDATRLTEAVLKAAAANEHNQGEIIGFLLEQDMEICVTAEIIETALENQGSTVAVKLLVDKRGKEVKITERMLLAAARHLTEGHTIFRLLLDERHGTLRIGDEVARAVTEGPNAKPIVKLLLERHRFLSRLGSGNIRFTSRARSFLETWLAAQPKDETRDH